MMVRVDRNIVLQTLDQTIQEGENSGKGGCTQHRSIYNAEKSLSPYAIHIVNFARVFPLWELLLLDTRAVGKNCLYHEWECILPET